MGRVGVKRNIAREGPGGGKRGKYTRKFLTSEQGVSTIPGSILSRTVDAKGALSACPKETARTLPADLSFPNGVLFFCSTRQ